MQLWPPNDDKQGVNSLPLLTWPRVLTEVAPEDAALAGYIELCGQGEAKRIYLKHVNAIR